MTAFPRSCSLCVLFLGFGFAFCSISARAQLVYVANNGSNSVSVINSVDNSVVATVPVGAGPMGLATSPDGKRVYVANSNSGDISIIDVTTNSVVGTIALPTPFSPTYLAVSPDGSRLWAVAFFQNPPTSNLLTSFVAIFDATTNQFLEFITSLCNTANITQPVFTPDGATVYFASNGLLEVPANSPDVTCAKEVLPAGDALTGGGFSGAAVSPDGTRIYMSSYAPDKIIVVDSATNLEVAAIPVNGGVFSDFGPAGIAVMPDSSRVYVVNQPSNSVSVIQGNAVVATVNVGVFPAGIAIIPDGKFAYVSNFRSDFPANAESDTVSVIDTDSNTIVATIPVGNHPWGVAIVPSGTASQPSSPTNLHAAQLSSSNGTQIKLTWNYGDDPIDGFIIERKPASSGNWTPLVAVAGFMPPGVCPQSPTIVDGLIASDVRCWVDTVPNAYATYSYRIQAARGSTISCPDPSSTCSTFSTIATCFQLSTQTPEEDGARVVEFFTPDPFNSLSSVIQELRTAGIADYDHFNWVSIINHYTVPRIIVDALGNQLRAPWLDPPLGGYGSPIFQSADPLPFYWNELPGFDASLASLGMPITGGPQDISTTAVFRDLPYDPLIPPGDYIGFFTTLVGVHSGVGFSPPNYTALNSFAWYTTNTGSTGGIGRFSSLDPPTISGTGGIFNVQIIENDDLPLDVRNLLIQNGLQGLSTATKGNRNAPLTAFFFLGQQGKNGWYTSSTSVTLIATDIDGPGDLASTSYGIDSGPMLAYLGPFSISTDGLHVIQFASIDQTGNAEALKSAVLKIDGTPPSITGARTPAPNANGWNNSDVTVSFACTDALSGLAPGSPPANTVFSGEGANQNVSGTCQDLAGNSVVATVGGINIDKTPPIISGMPAAGCTFNETGKLIRVATVSGTDALSGLASLNVSVTSSQTSDDASEPDIVVTGSGLQPKTVQIRIKIRNGTTNRTFMVNSVATDAAGNTNRVSRTCTVTKSH